MPDSAERQALLTAAADLQAGMLDLSRKFADVETFSSETRAIARACAKTNQRLAAIVAVLGLVILALGVTTWRANNANDKATRTQEYQFANCELANETRTANVKLWSSINALMLAPQPGRPEPSKALLKFTKDIKTQVDEAFKLRDCSQVAEGKTG